MHKKEYEFELAGKKITAEFSDLADQTDGAVLLKSGETVVLATVVMSKDENPSASYFNLTVDYIEKFYASGKILGSRFTRREGKPGDEAVLAGRVIDRTIRPLFNQSTRHSVQVIATVLAVGEEDPGILAVNAVSLALLVSDVPWAGPIGAVRIKKMNGNITINPTQKMRNEEEFEYDLIVCGKKGNINMIEALSHENKNDEIEEAIKIASDNITKLENFQNKIVLEIGKPKREIIHREISAEAKSLFEKEISSKIKESIFTGPGKKKIDELHNIWNDLVKTNFQKEEYLAEDEYFDNTVNDTLHREAIENNHRADDRKMDQVRELYAQAGGVSSMLHGSGIFYRGGTHVLSVLTLGGPDDAHTIDTIENNEEKRFMHHYNFPPYSSGETGRATMVNRREIGHGALAEKALSMVLPPKEIFPYTIRVVSESMASNGSTSMASVCAGSLAMMDGGVPIKSPVAGIAMGLMYKNDSQYKILTDIQGPEDHHGDMDFKVAGTKNGITAIQLDVKVEGVPIKILSEALIDAEKARLHILETITKELSEHRIDISIHAPKILTIKIKIDQIGLVIGTGGKVINGIKDKTGAEITIEDDGTVFITGKNGSAEKALTIIELMTKEYKIGEITKGEVVKIMDFGAFVKIAENTEGLVHISEIANFRVNKVTDVIKEGDIVPVKIIKVDERGRLNFSIKEAGPNFAKNTKNIV